MFSFFFGRGGGGELYGFNPFPNDKILDSSNQREFADDNFKFDENGRKFSKLEEMLVTSNFSFSYSIFKRFLLQTRKSQGLFGKGLRWNYPLAVLAKVKVECVEGKSCMTLFRSGPVFTNHSLERSLSYSPDFSMF